MWNFCLIESSEECERIMADCILNESNANESKEYFYKAVDIGEKFKLRSEFKKIVNNSTDDKELFSIPKRSTSMTELLNLFEGCVAPQCTNFSSPGFMGFPDTGNSVAGITGAILSDFMQQNLINQSFCAPIATKMEIAVINWLRNIVGYPCPQNIQSIRDVGGIITYGGTGSNASAMLIARENHVPNTMNNGVKCPEHYKVILPKGIDHYSIAASLKWLGLGNSIIEVDTKNYKYDLKCLKDVLLENKGDVMSVVVYAGDSRTMTIDNLTDVYELVKSIDDSIWLHLDACHGFSVALSKKYKYMVKGMNLYDSISTDPHKVLNIPYCVSALLLKHPENILKVKSSSDLIMNEDLSLGQTTPFIGSKSWVSLKIWFAMKNIGLDGLDRLVTQRMDLARKLYDYLRQDDSFIVLNEVNINSVMFMYKPKGVSIKNKKGISIINKINKRIYNQLQKEGRFYIHCFPIKNESRFLPWGTTVTPLRYMSGNENLTWDTLVKFVEHIRSIGSSFYKNRSDE